MLGGVRVQALQAGERGVEPRRNLLPRHRHGGLHVLGLAAAEQVEDVTQPFDRPAAHECRVRPRPAAVPEHVWAHGDVPFLAVGETVM